MKLQVENLSLSFGKKTILKDLSFELEEGEIGCFLGPSGSGKTTLLRSIAGLERPQGGTIVLQGRVVAGEKTFVPPEQREMGMVFQDYALFPHLTVAENLSLGLHHLPRNEKEKRVKKFLEISHLEKLSKSFPHEISGGEQQRVAVMRALIRFPRMLLLDEPFSSLDVHLRATLAREIKSLLKEFNMTSLLVTHDQQEAFALADRIGVIREGRLLQWGTGFSLYHQPQDPFVAKFVGEGPFILGRVIPGGQIETALGTIDTAIPAWAREGDRVRILLRPNDVILDPLSPIKAQSIQREFRGTHFLFTMELPEGERVFALVPCHQSPPETEKILGVRWEARHVLLFPVSDLISHAPHS